MIPEFDNTPKNNTFLKSWFVSVDDEFRPILNQGRIRILASLLLLLVLHVIILFAEPDAFMHAALTMLSLVLLVYLAYIVWVELIDPLLRLCYWADSMRAVNLDSRVQLRSNSDFAELGSDVNMLSKMIQELSQETDKQLELHTDFISRESRILSMLYDISSNMNSSLDLNELFEKALVSFCTNLNALGGIIRQIKDDNSHLVAASYGNFSPSFLQQIDDTLPMDHSVDDSEEPRIYTYNLLPVGQVFGNQDDKKQNLQVVSIPIRYRRGQIGALHLFFPSNRVLELEHYSDLMLTLGRNLGNSIERFRLIEEENQLNVIRERTRLSHELHDSLAQTLASVRIQMRLIDEVFHSGDEQSIWHHIERVEYAIEQANVELRELITHFRGPLVSRGLVPSIEELANRTKEDASIKVYFQSDWPERNFPEHVELNVFRIIQESLANIRKHSQADVVRILLRYRDDMYTVLIEDDGVGFDESTITPEGGSQLGLNILRDRANQIGGHLDIESEPGEGTRIHLEFWLPAEAAKLVSAQ